MLNEEVRLKKAHIAIMRHPKTSLYSGVVASGKNEVTDGKYTAYTNGVDKKYSRSFITKLSDQELRFLVLHENLHVALKHLPRHRDLWKEDQQLANVSADYVVNDVIISTGAETNRVAMFKMPEGGLYCKPFHDWSVREVYNYLKKEQDKQKSMGNDGSKIPLPDGEILDLNSLSDNQDEHDWEMVDGMDAKDMKDLSDKIDKAIRQGGMLAGRMGAEIPRVIGEMLEPKVDWREVLREFISSQMRGKDEMTWRRLNKRQLVNDFYLPSVISETVGEIVVAIDTSGSIGNEQIGEFASELASICEGCNPEAVRVLWWDTMVHGEQLFNEGQYGNLGALLKPQGGGGTHVGCVSKYIGEKSINAECVLVFTDGYVESDIEWDITSPTVWFVTENKSFNPPMGGKLVMVQD